MSNPIHVHIGLDYYCTECGGTFFKSPDGKRLFHIPNKCSFAEKSFMRPTFALLPAEPDSWEKSLIPSWRTPKE